MIAKALARTLGLKRKPLEADLTLVTCLFDLPAFDAESGLAPNRHRLDDGDRGYLRAARPLLRHPVPLVIFPQRSLLGRLQAIRPEGRLTRYVTFELAELPLFAQTYSRLAELYRIFLRMGRLGFEADPDVRADVAAARKEALIRLPGARWRCRSGYNDPRRRQAFSTASRNRAATARCWTGMRAAPPESTDGFHAQECRFLLSGRRKILPPERKAPPVRGLRVGMK